METASSTGGAAGVAAVLTSVLPTTLEDLMALALAGGLSYISFLSWPLKRGEIKGEVAAKYDGVAAELDAALGEELEGALGRLRERVSAMTAPLEERAAAEESTVAARQERLTVRAAGLGMVSLAHRWLPHLRVSGCCDVVARVATWCRPRSAHHGRRLFVQECCLATA